MCDLEDLDNAANGTVRRERDGALVVKLGNRWLTVKSGTEVTAAELAGASIEVFNPDEPRNPRFIEWWVDGVGITSVSWDDAARGYPKARTDAARWERTAQQHERKVWELQRELIRIRFDEGGNV